MRKGHFAGIGAARFGRHAASEFAEASVVARGHDVGGVGDGIAHRLADSTSVPAFAAVAARGSVAGAVEFV